MNISRDQFKNKDNSITINGVEYLVPLRTKAIQDKLLELKRGNYGEYEEYMGITEIILGKKEAKEIFPNGKNEPLDYMALVVVGIFKVYDYERSKVLDEKYEEACEKLDPLLKSVDKAEKLMNLKNNAI